jgi:hypothetical protein
VRFRALAHVSPRLIDLGVMGKNHDISLLQGGSIQMGRKDSKRITALNRKLVLGQVLFYFILERVLKSRLRSQHQYHGFGLLSV